ncbi:hypothetical protein DYB28_015710 [Aphanomyces astaci]|uniref:GMP reductase n=1 Tax=Aphanomyces astaci TaxID=112090 RepID=A0A9X8HAR4_APHAT|nr:hypothetical protein DYB28_015710 [Aphanomyces astaci]
MDLISRFCCSTMPRIETEPKLDFKDVLIRPKRSTLKSRSQVDVSRTFTFRNSKRTWTGVSDPDVLPFIAVSAGTSTADLERVSSVLNAHPAIAFVCLDVANGYSEHFVDAVRLVRAQHPTHTIIAGNVVTGEMVEELVLSGADIIKIGIGPGSVCTTRKQTGVGYPQLSAVLESADAAHGLRGHVISDGGCTCPGDVAKAFGAGYVLSLPSLPRTSAWNI